MVTINQPLTFQLPEDLARQIGEQVRLRRLADNLTRKTLAERSGVPEATIRKFEVSGVISLVGILKLADALGCMDDFSRLFPQKTTTTIEEFMKPTRKRGRK